MDHAPINVTRSYLPPKEDFLRLVDEIYATGALTNNGPLHRRLEQALRARYDLPHLHLMANGTLAIQIALRALEVKGEVITTPFSYVATTSAILWEGCTPVFADVLPDTLCIDPAQIEAAITPATTAILATHVFGIPCDVDAIAEIAQRHGLKVIYDASHAFGAQYKGKPLAAYGDASTLSFHATKLFHTVEGGATIVHDAATAHRVRLLRSFGHINDDHFSLGMNAKMSELHAAMGLLVLPRVDELVARRKVVCEHYDTVLSGRAERPRIPQGTAYNYGYYPVLLPDAVARERAMEALAVINVFPRRYFYPSLDTLPYVQAAVCPVSRDAAARVLCLPLYPELVRADVERIANCLAGILTLV